MKTIIPPKLSPEFINLWDSDDRMKISAFLMKQMATGGKAKYEWARTVIKRLKEMSPESAISEVLKIFEQEQPDIVAEFKDFLEIDKEVHEMRAKADTN